MDAAHKRRWQTFEVVFGIPCLFAIALQWGLPLAFPPGWLTALMVAAGMALIVAGLALVVAARRELARQAQPTDPGNPTTQLVTTGVFSVSRNPLYLGGVGLLVGIALAFNLPWLLVLLLPALFACHTILILPEEKYLAATFGAEYARYRHSVPRWLGRRRVSTR